MIKSLTYLKSSVTRCQASSYCSGLRKIHLKYISLICKHGGFGQFEIEQEGREYTITLIHELGEKWSNFLANWMKAGMKSAIGIVPRIDVMQNSVITKFTAP